VAEAPKLATELATKLEATDVQEVVDESVSRSLRELAAVDAPATANEPTGIASKEDASRRAFNLRESVGNVLKRLSARAVQSLRQVAILVAEAVTKEAKDRLRAGVRWILDKGATLLFGYFATTYPWLETVIAYIKSLLPLL
jgi:hypothetical protein